MTSSAPQNTHNLRFVTSVYGEKYGGMLLALLYSIHTSHPKAKATIFWRDVTPATRLLEKAFSEFDFIDISHPIDGTFISRIAHKTVLWAEAARRHAGENLIFVDVDMLVRKDVEHFFSEDFDLAFTYKDSEIYPINTGTFLTRGTATTAAFFDRWEKETKKIMQDKELLRRATIHDFPYGAPDQMAFYEMIQYQKGKKRYQVTIEGTQLSCAGFPCEMLNETNSVPITETTAIIHYKGGWHNILLNGRGFTFRRPRGASWEMYFFYIKTYEDAVRYVSDVLGQTFSIKKFGVKKHFYLSKKLRVSNLLRVIFDLWQKVMGPVYVVYDRARRKLSV